MGDGRLVIRVVKGRLEYTIGISSINQIKEE